MINHLRTLLLNLPGETGIYTNIPGDELIDPTFKPLVLPTYLQSIRSVLCGLTPDRAMLNYRARQLLGLIHGSRYANYALAFDPRVTYLNSVDLSFYLPATFIPQIVSQMARPTSMMYVSGQEDPPDADGIMQQQWLVSVTGPATVLAQRQPNTQQWIDNYALNGNLSQVIPLGGSGYNFQFNGLQGDAWQIVTMAQPKRSISEMVPILQGLNATALVSLFTLQNAEPWNTFRNLWQSAPETGNRLIGLLLAYFYQLESIRVYSGG